MAAATNPNPNMPGIDGYDDSGHQVVKFRAKNVITDTSVTPNIVVGDLGIEVEVSFAGGQAGYVALTSPPANTSANADTPLTFSQQVNHFGVQNNTSVNAYIRYESAASLNSLVLMPGGYLREEKQLTVLHVFTVTAQPINAANGLIVEGWL